MACRRNSPPLANLLMRHRIFSLQARITSTLTWPASGPMANHSDPRTTKLYDRLKDLATLSEVERRIAFEWLQGD